MYKARLSSIVKLSKVVVAVVFDVIGVAAVVMVVVVFRGRSLFYIAHKVPNGLLCYVNYPLSINLKR